MNSAGTVEPFDPIITASKPINFAGFRKGFEINLHGTVYCSALCAFYMAKNKEEEKGVIINVSSITSWEGF